MAMGMFGYSDEVKWTTTEGPGWDMHVETGWPKYLNGEKDIDRYLRKQERGREIIVQLHGLQRGGC